MRFPEGELVSKDELNRRKEARKARNRTAIQARADKKSVQNGAATRPSPTRVPALIDAAARWAIAAGINIDEWYNGPAQAPPPPPPPPVDKPVRRRTSRQGFDTSSDRGFDYKNWRHSSGSTPT